MTDDPTYKDNHLEEAISNLLTQYQNKERIEALVNSISGSSGVQDLEDDLRDVKESRILENATGDSLDIIGDLAGMPRLGLPDNDYRNLIEVKFLSNRSSGTIEEMIEIASSIPGVLDKSVIDVQLTGTSGTTIPAGSRIKDSNGKIWILSSDATLDDTALFESEQESDEGYPRTLKSEIDTTSGSGSIIDDVSEWDEAIAQRDSISGVKYYHSYPAGMVLEIVISTFISSELKDKINPLIKGASPAGVKIEISELTEITKSYEPFKLDKSDGHQLDKGRLARSLK
jgi:hypothetical protein